jgi:hypothetical protein
VREWRGEWGCPRAARVLHIMEMVLGCMVARWGARLMHECHTDNSSDTCGQQSDRFGGHFWASSGWIWVVGLEAKFLLSCWPTRLLMGS